MRMKAAFLIGGAVGYVLGTRAGRQQFETIKDQAQKLWENPKVQESISGVEQKVREKAPELKDKLTGGGGDHGTGDGPSDTPDELGTFTTAGTDETETTTYPRTGGTSF